MWVGVEVGGADAVARNKDAFDVKCSRFELTDDGLGRQASRRDNEK